MIQLDPNISIFHLDMTVPASTKGMYQFFEVPFTCNKMIAWNIWAEVDSTLHAALLTDPKPNHTAGNISFKMETKGGIVFQAPVPIYNELWDDDYMMLGITNPLSTPYKGSHMAGAGTRIYPTFFEVETGIRHIMIYYEDTIMDAVGTGSTVDVHLTLYYTDV